mgnify:CR=1 FL=1|jgi:hypothetical protein
MSILRGRTEVDSMRYDQRAARLRDASSEKQSPLSNSGPGTSSPTEVYNTKGAVFVKAIIRENALRPARHVSHGRSHEYTRISTVRRQEKPRMDANQHSTATREATNAHESARIFRISLCLAIALSRPARCADCQLKTDCYLINRESSRNFGCSAVRRSSKRTISVQVSAAQACFMRRRANWRLAAVREEIASATM